MKKQTKTITILVLLLILVAYSILGVPPTHAKYIISEQAMVWQSIFDASLTLADLFHITNPNGETSQVLWGASKDGEITSGDVTGEYNATNVIDVTYPVYNATSEYMLITFKISYTSPDGLGVLPCGINNTDFDDVVDGIENSHLYTAQFQGSMGELAYTWGLQGFNSTILSTNYYYYRGGVNPLDVMTNLEKVYKYFVVAPESLGTAEASAHFQLTLDMDTLLGSFYSRACYASIEMESIPVEITWTDGVVTAITPKLSN